MNILTAKEARMIDKEKYRVVIGEELSKETSEFIKDMLLAKNTSGAVSSIRKAIVAAKDELDSKVGFTTVIYAINRYAKVTEKTQPVIERILEMALEIKASKSNSK
jgi:hypothetical protein